MSSIVLSGLVVQPIALRVEEWLAEGKLTEEDLESALVHDERALVDHGISVSDWVPLEVVECLVALASSQLGGETGLVEWAGEIVASWREGEIFESWIARARGLVDGPGFLAAHASELLLRDPEWCYEGGRMRFSLRLGGVGSATPELTAFLGSLLARLAEEAAEDDIDVRFTGVDEDELVVFADYDAGALIDPTSESRLLRAALVGGL
jgi:hypothetical protein